MSSKIVYLLPLCLAVTACSVKDDMDSMKKNTAEMNETTKDMNRTMKEMNRSLTERMDKLSGKMDKMDALSEKMSAMLEEIKSMSSQMSKLDKMDALAGHMVSMLAEMKGLSDKMDKMDKLDAMSENMSSMLNEIKSMATQMNKLDKMDELALHMISMLTEMKSMSGQMGKLDKMDTLADHMIAMLTEMKGMSGKMDKMTEMTELMRIMQEHTRQTIEKMSNVLTALQSTQTEIIQLRKSVGELYRMADKLSVDTRQALSVELRRKRLEEIGNVTGLKSKILAAAIYYSSFEYQLWRDMGENAQGHWDRMLSDAVEHVINDAHRFNKDSYDTSPGVVPRINIPLVFSNNDNTSLMALAAAMHWKNPQHLVVAKETGRPVPSMYDLIETALLAKKDLSTGSKSLKDLAPYVSSVLRFEHDAIYLMHLRYNALALQLIGQSGDARETLSDATSKAMGSWDLDLGRLNSAQLADNLTVLQHWNRTRELLLKIGQKPVLNSMIARVINNAKVINPLGKDGQPAPNNGDCTDVDLDQLPSIFTPTRICQSEAQLAKKLEEGFADLKHALKSAR